MINWTFMADAVANYKKLGYTEVDVPWLVSAKILDLTRPAPPVEYKGIDFIGSGEQGFLENINKGFLPDNGKFQTVTPCIRDDICDETHLTQFMKLELIDYNSDFLWRGNKNKQRTAVIPVLENAWKFFSTLVEESRMEIIETSSEDAISFDIELDGYEIGSYGYRSCLFCEWVYGTGLAEPRFSRIRTRGKQCQGITLRK